jgi:hypothetical protein
LSPSIQAASDGILQIRNGYFWDPVVNDYFVPRGIAYQIWNPPVGANQSFDQVDYDLLEFQKMYANSVRCEFVWSQIQTGSNTWDFAKSDHLVAQAEKLGLKLFVIIGFQYPPPWFPPEWRNVNEQGLTPDVLACLGTNTTSSVTNCLPQPIYDHLYTNDLRADAIDATLHCLTSSVASNVIACLQQNVPSDYQTTETNILSYFVSDVINYENPDARRAYTNNIAKIVDRYKNSPAIGAWIMGNEYAYFDLWEDPNLYPVRRFIGYDAYSQAAFRNYLKILYSNNIAALNANWQANYSSFDAVQMPHGFPADRNAPAFTDLIHWRQQSIGGFVAAGAMTARTCDPNHLLTYSMVGGVFNGNDANNTCEDAPSIVAACRQAGAPLDFWSINNYAWASEGSELRTADFGISKYEQLLGIPLMISETGHSSTETEFPGGPRQPKAVPGQIWESLISGAIGTHIFTWNDRSQFTQFYFERERGFGIVNEDRSPKEPVYDNVVTMFRRMRDFGIERLLGNSSNPPPDVQLFWSKASDLTWPSANQENTMLWGAIRRLGFQPGIIDDQRFQQQAYTNAPVLLLSRCWQLNPADLDTIATTVVGSGIHLHANGDPPGQVNAYVQTNPKWASYMNSLFGLDVTKAFPGYEHDAVDDVTALLLLHGAGSLGAITRAYFNEFKTWDIWNELRSIAGSTVLTDTGAWGTNSPMPAVQVTTLSHAKTAINSFAVGETHVWGTNDPAPLYDLRYDILRAIYRSHFGLTPIIDISGPGEKRVLPDYRLCQNGSVLVSLLNEDTNTEVITVSAPSLWKGKVIEDLTSGGIVDTNSSGTLNFTLSGDQYVLLYAYNRANGQDNSLINSNPNKLWFSNAPRAVWPNGSSATNLQIGYDVIETDLQLGVRFEQVSPVQRVLAQATSVSVAGQGTNALALIIPDPDLNDPDHVSSANGGEYVFHATLEKDGVLVSDTSLPVRLLWAVQPISPLPITVTAGSTYQIPVEWQELPSYQPNDPMPLDRASLWQSVASDSQYYNIVLELQDAAGHVVASDVLATSLGSGTNVFSITVPRGAQGPFTWTALAQSAPATVSINVDDSFEGRDRGEDRRPFYPWFDYTYSEFNNVPAFPPQGEGVTYVGTIPGTTTVSNLVAYLVATNPPNPGSYSGFGLKQGSVAPWSLPANHALWSQYTFSFDFKESNGLPCVMGLQLKDTNYNWIQFTKTYVPGTNGWDTIAAPVSQFTPAVGSGVFDPNHVMFWYLNIAMLQTNTTYTGYFDNVHFVGPPNLEDDFQDRSPGFYYIRIAPWMGYGYDANKEDDVLLNEGVSLDDASDGSQAAFLVAWYQTTAGADAGFGMIEPFPNVWSLPADTNQWHNYSFSFDFREDNGQPCILELQVKNPDTVDPTTGVTNQHALHFTKPYTPVSNNWDTISATLDRFTVPTNFPFGSFDPTHITDLALNVQMLQNNPQTNVIYIGWFDNVRFHGPVNLAPGVATYGFYSSTNDSFRIADIELNRTNNSMTVSWVGSGVLQEASAITGPWTNVVGVTSPARLPLAGSLMFYRLRQ